MTDIFLAFLWFWDANSSNSPTISQRFPFPDLNGMTAEGEIKFWTNGYFGGIVPAVSVKPCQQSGDGVAMIPISQKIGIE